MPLPVYLPGEGPHDLSCSTASDAHDEFYDAVTEILIAHTEDSDSDAFDTSTSSRNVLHSAGEPSQVDRKDSDISQSSSRKSSLVSLSPKSEASPLEIDEDSKDSPNKGSSGRFEDCKDAWGSAQRQIRSAHCFIQPAELIFPRSQYSVIFSESTQSFEEFVPPLPVCKERTAVKELLHELDRQNAAHPEKSSSANAVFDDYVFTEFELSDFSVYLPGTSAHHAFEMRSLDQLASGHGNSYFLFDGILSTGGLRRYVQGVPFQVCSIGNYGEDHVEVGSDVWIQSEYNGNQDIFYRLKNPLPEYARFHKGFTWLANLAKHFVDYCQSALLEGKSVSIHDFRADFSIWLLKKHQQDSRFQEWYRKHQSHDFRRAINQNINFLNKEALGVDDELRSHCIWSEVMDKTAIRKHEIREQETVVTPYIYDCFSHLKFGKLLKPIAPVTEAETRRTSQGAALHLSTDEVSTDNIPAPVTQCSEQSLADRTFARQQMIRSVKVGNVLSVVVDGFGSVWKDEVSQWKAADNCWYLLVQGIHEESNGERSFDGIWLYKSHDTTCAKMKYPFPNELFLSDHCTCNSQREKEERVIDIVDVAWNGSPVESNSGSNLFIRQTYLDGERFVTFKDTHKKCEHLRKEEESPIHKIGKYPPGSTVLVKATKVHRISKHAIEPYEVVDYVQDGPQRVVLLRRLLRRVEVDGQGAPNELVYTNKIDKGPLSAIQHHCLIRFYSEAEVRSGTIPAPYCRDGTGNAFYIRTSLNEENGVQRLMPIDAPSSFAQGFDPTVEATQNILRGLDLYCGGGNLGRGLEEGGAVRHKWAVDIGESAIYSYHANLEDPKGTKLFYGSVDDLLTEALKGNPRNSMLVAMPGQIDVISAGSPCQGFSLLNGNKNSEKALKNQSLVASVAAFVDFYRPKYGILENVMSMAQKGRGRDEDVLSQLLCAIVGMGYQAQVFILDAWSCGSPQTRSRLFVCFAAPGYEPLEHPYLSHSHPPNVKETSIGLLSNRESIARRRFVSTAFEYVTIGQATSDLPRIGDGRTYCTPHPDHTVVRSLKEKEQARIACIPTHPVGMNFVKTWNNGKGTMSNAERSLFPHIAKNGLLRESIKPMSRAWGRVDPSKLISTVVVSLSAEDARMGTCIHWNQQRYVSIMEGRRAQSFPDHEVLVGSPTQQWKIIGNSVARTVALALGLSLREAWLKNAPDEGFLADASLSKTATGPEHKRSRYPQVIIPRQLSRLTDSSDESSMPISRDEQVSSSRSSCTTDSIENFSSKRGAETSILPPKKKFKFSLLSHGKMSQACIVSAEAKSQDNGPVPNLQGKGSSSQVPLPTTSSKTFEVVIYNKKQHYSNTSEDKAVEEPDAGAEQKISEESEEDSDDLMSTGVVLRPPQSTLIKGRRKTGLSSTYEIINLVSDEEGEGELVVDEPASEEKEREEVRS